MSAASLPDSPPSERLAAWQVSLGQAVRTPRELCRRLDLDGTELVGDESHHDFPVLVPLEYLARIEPGNPRDPLLLQVLPTPEETDCEEGTADPVGDQEAQQVRGLLQKYAGRVLLMPTLACAVHCRYCFRRNYLDAGFFEASPARRQTRPGGAEWGSRALSNRWHEAIDFVADSPSVREVILSGGDPLMLPDRELAQWVGELSKIPHVTTLRIHTRLPVMIPSRIDERLASWLESTRLQTVVVFHANHPREIDGAVAEAAGRLRRAGATVLNQSVLLKGVNDSSRTLVDLSRRLFAADILPYYLHQLDEARGATHFRVPIETGRRIIEQMRQELPGYLIPRYVRETPGAASKTTLA